MTEDVCDRIFEVCATVEVPAFTLPAVPHPCPHHALRWCESACGDQRMLLLRGAIKLVAQTRAKADICELIEVAAKASLADGLSQEMHLLREELDTIPSVSEDTLPKIAQLAEKIGTPAGAVLDATKVDDFVGVLLRHAEDSLDAAVADAAAAIISLRSEWRRRTWRTCVHTRLRQHRNSGSAVEAWRLL